MKSDRVVLAVFTGTGNTLVAATALAERLERAGKRVRMIPMERPGRLEEVGFDGDATLGLAVPVACFTSYPTVWRFIEALPAGVGREAFLLATMGGMGLGMQGPIGSALARKGYRLSGARLFAVAGNYGSGAPKGEALEAARAKAKRRAEAFGDSLLDGKARWGGTLLYPVAAFFAWLGRRKTSFTSFRRHFPLTVAAGTCVGCGACEELCPEGNIAIRDGKAVIGDDCQSCQRCVGFCPAGAIGVSGKPVSQYRMTTPDVLRAFLDAPR